MRSGEVPCLRTMQSTNVRLSFDSRSITSETMRVQIETVPKRGYRLIAPVTSIDADAAEEQSSSPMIVSVGTRTVVIKPIKPGGSTSRGKAFAQRIRSEMVAQLNQLTNVVVRPQTEVPVETEWGPDLRW